MAGNFPSDFSDYEPRNPLSHPGRADFFLKIFRKIPKNLAEIRRKRGQKSPVFIPGRRGGSVFPLRRIWKTDCKGLFWAFWAGLWRLLGSGNAGIAPTTKTAVRGFWGCWEGAAKMPRSDWAAVPGAGAAVAVWAGLCGLIWDGVKLGHGRRVPGRSWAAVEGMRKAPGRISQGRRVHFDQTGNGCPGSYSIPRISKTP